MLALALTMTAGCRRAPRAAVDEPTASNVVDDGVVARPVIDSHVHLSYWPVADDLADAGLGAAIDLGAPEDALDDDAPLLVLRAGPMLTRPGGYPIDAWDPGGFGAGCGDEACLDATIDRLAARGARVIKLVTGDDGLSPALAAHAVARAHRHGLPVAAHALDDAAARAAAAAGCDLLAHTPVEPLTDATVQAWSTRAVISTLVAFGGRATTVDNLRRLRAAGATVLYGTDLGNDRVAGVDPEELRLLAAAGLDGPAIVAAMTTTPAAYWHLAELAGPIDRTRGSYLVLAREPAADPAAYLAPRAVFVHGQRRR